MSDHWSKWHHHHWFLITSITKLLFLYRRWWSHQELFLFDKLKHFNSDLYSVLNTKNKKASLGFSYKFVASGCRHSMKCRIYSVKRMGNWLVIWWHPLLWLCGNLQILKMLLGMVKYSLLGLKLSIRVPSCAEISVFVNRRLLLETKYRRLPVVDSVGRLVSIIVLSCH